MVEFLHSIKALFEVTSGGKPDNSWWYCNEVMEQLMSEFYDVEVDIAFGNQMYAEKKGSSKV